MAYINPTPGVANSEIVVELDFQANATITSGSIALSAGKLVIPAISKLTVTTSNGVFEWAQLDTRSKKVVATVATNSLVADIIVDHDSFFGNTALSAGSFAQAGIWAAQRNKTYLAFKIRMDGSTTGSGDTVSGVGYITNLAPTIAAEQPVWQTPVTIVVDGDFTITPNDTL